MAEATHTTRRSLFAIAAGAALLPPALAASQTPWDGLLAALNLLDPRLAEQGEIARQQGFEPQQLYMVLRSAEGPLLVFRKTVDGVTGPYVFDGAANGAVN